MANKTVINLNEKIPLEEEVDNPVETLDSVDAPPNTQSEQPANGSDLPPSSGTGAAADGPATVEDGEVKVAVDPVDPQAGKDGEPADDVQKKIRRAERFGMPVQLSEQEKRNSRAERFGTRSGPIKSDDMTKSEELKRKARAERFGAAVAPADADEEAKKKARVARFTSSPKVDAEEEEKRKARAIRFSNPPLGSLSQVNGKEAITSKASEGS